MEHIEELYDKYLDGTITSAEKEELFDRIENADRNDLTRLSGKYLNAKVPEDLSHLEEPSEELLQRINQFISDRDRRKPIKLWLRIAVAASVLLMTTFVIYQYQHKEHNEFNNNSQIVKVLEDVSPGSKRATLTFAGGRTIVLDSADTGQLAVVDGTRISKTAEGQLRYQEGSKGTGKTELNTISIPRGGEYQLLLSDGTHVWLNAATTITYPTRFVGNERRIRLRGEAYLEVAKDPEHSFIVETDNQIIQVLGTHFNVNTYNANRIITTLEEGSVRVSALRGTKQSIVMKPGEQVVNNNGLSIQPADLEVVLAWKNGLFVFRDASLQTVLNEISRWYDLEIIYKGTPPVKTLSGGVSRYSNLSAVLHILKLTGVKATLITEDSSKKIIIEP